MSWQQYHLREILELKYGKSLPEREREPGDIPVYGSGGIGGFHNVELVNSGLPKINLLCELRWEHRRSLFPSGMHV